MFYIAFKNLVLIILIILILHFFIKNTLLDKENREYDETYEDKKEMQQTTNMFEGPVHDNINEETVNSTKKDEDDLLNYINNTSSSDLGTFSSGTFAMFNSPF